MYRHQPRTNDPYRLGQYPWGEGYPEEDPPPYHYAVGMPQPLDDDWSDDSVYEASYASYPEPGSLPPAGRYSGNWQHPNAGRAAVYQQGTYGDSARTQSVLSRCLKCGASFWQGTADRWGHTGEGASYSMYPYPNGPSQTQRQRCPTCGSSQTTHSQFTGAGPLPAHNVYGPEPFDSFDGQYPDMGAGAYNSQQRYQWQQRQHQTPFGPYKATEGYDYQGQYPSTMYPHDHRSRANSLYGLSYGAGSSMGMSSGNGVMPGTGSYYHNAADPRAVNSTCRMPFNQYGNESGRW